MRHCFVVSGAGDASFNGVYEVDSSRIGGLRSRGDTRACYRKVGAANTMNFNRGDRAWYLCKDHSGAWYKVLSEEFEPPVGGWTVAGKGTSPAPTVRVTHTVGLTVVQPLTFRVKNANFPGADCLDGLYVVDLEQGEKDGVACYRRVGGWETLHRSSGSWHLSIRHKTDKAWLQVRAEKYRAQSSRAPLLQRGLLALSSLHLCLRLRLHLATSATASNSASTYSHRGLSL